MPSPTETGRRAEELAAGWLSANGFTVIDRNWRNRWCEIDIVAHKDQTIHFVEVKFRASNNWGSGLDYMDANKISRLRRASLAWLHYHGRSNASYVIDLMAVDGAGKLNYIEGIILD